MSSNIVTDRPTAPATPLDEGLLVDQHLSDAEQLRADGLRQPAALALGVSTDNPFATMARRIRSDGIR